MAPDDLFDSYDDEDNAEEIRLGLAIPDNYKFRRFDWTSEHSDLWYRIRRRRHTLRINRLKGATE